MNKFTNLMNELIRVTTVVFSRESFATYRTLYGLDWFGKPSVKHIYYRGWGRGSITIQRDHLDVIIDVVTDIYISYTRAIDEALCTHPKQDVWVGIEGEEDYGFVNQYHCSKCGGYVSPDDVSDRFDGGTEIIRDFALPAYIPANFYPSVRDINTWGLGEIDFPLMRITRYTDLLNNES